MNSQSISLNFLTFFKELIDLEFNEKMALNSIQTIHKPFEAQCNFIYTKLNSGSNFFQILNTSFSPFWYLNSSISSLNLSQWLEYKIRYIKDTKEFLKFIKKTLTGPIALFGLSFILNLYLAIFFIPKITTLLTDFNTPIPYWIKLIEQFKHYVNLYFVPFSLSLGCIIYILKNPLKRLITTLTFSTVKEIFVIDLFSLINPYLNQGVDLKTIVKSISVTKSKKLQLTLDEFKSSILNSASYTTSFSMLISNSTYVQIITQAIATNKLEFGLTKIISLYRTTHKMKLIRLSNTIKIIALIFTGLNILIGFYLTILPMNQIIGKLISHPS